MEKPLVIARNEAISANLVINEIALFLAMTLGHKIMTDH